MLNNMNSTKDLYNIPGVEDLSCDTAAAVQGGAAMTLYRHINLKGDVLAKFDGGGVRWMSSNANNQASSVKITEGRWRFFSSPNWNPIGVEGGPGWVTLGRGTYNFTDIRNLIGGSLNDKISSFKRVS
jgi:hypothetical protein